MKNKLIIRTLSIGLVTTALGIGTVYMITSAVADGIPADNPMTYSGVLEEDGQLVDGNRNLRIVFWDSPSATGFDNIWCQTQAQNIPVANGRFRVALDDACTFAVQEVPDMWVEVEVNGDSLGRTKVSAVPYAVESARAADLTQEARESLVPTGTVVAFIGNEAPEGWLLCDGSAVPRAGEYNRLFSVIGTSHGGGDGASTFNLPDYRGMFLRGVDRGRGVDPDANTRTAANLGGNTGDTVGTTQGGATAIPTTAFRTDSQGTHTHTGTTASAGSHTHTASTASAGSHTHTGTTASAGAHTHSITMRRHGDDGGSNNWNYANSGGVSSNLTTASAGAHTHSFTTSSTGSHTHTVTVDTAGTHSHTFTALSAGAHTHVILSGGDAETRPANAAVNYIIKY